MRNNNRLDMYYSYKEALGVFFYLSLWLLNYYGFFWRFSGNFLAHIPFIVIAIIWISTFISAIKQMRQSDRIDGYYKYTDIIKMYLLLSIVLFFHSGLWWGYIPYLVLASIWVLALITNIRLRRKVETCFFAALLLILTVFAIMLHLR